MDKREKLPLSAQVFYSSGALGDYLMMSMIGTLAINIYHVGLGASAVLIGWALAIPRLWDAFTDPVIANISDNVHTRFGRRRPFILAGAGFTAVFCVLIWRPPVSLGEHGLVAYFFVFSMLYYTAFTVFSIPYHALGLELTSDYDERTRLMSLKSIFAGAGGIFLMPWAYKLCFVLGGDEVEGVNREVVGVRTVGIIYGALMVIFVIFPAVFCRERFANANREKMPIINAIKCTIKNRPFIILCVSIVLTMVGVYIVAPLGMIINMTYVYAGDKEASAMIGGIYGTIYSICAVASVPLVSYLGTRFGKKRILVAGLLLSASGFLLSWFLINPAMPYLQLLLAIIVAPGLSAVTALLAYALLADICDLDELNTGLRREGMYTAVYTWSVKMSSTCVLVLTGYLLVWTGFDPDNLLSTPQTVLKLRLAMMLIPSGFMLSAAFVMTFYRLNRAKVEQIQAQLMERRSNDQEATTDLEV